MRNIMKKFNEMMVYFFTPEEAPAGAGVCDGSFGFNSQGLSLGSLKVLFWVAATFGVFSLFRLL